MSDAGGDEAQPNDDAMEVGLPLKDFEFDLVQTKYYT